jgi:transposase
VELPRFRRLCRILQSYRKEGNKAIKFRETGTRGRRAGEQHTLSPDQESDLCKALIDKTPDQMKLPSALWTWDVVKQLIRQWFGIHMPIRTVGEYLKRWRFPPQKPVKRAYVQSSQAVKKWLETDYPSSASRAKQEKCAFYDVLGCHEFRAFDQVHDPLDQ